MATTKNILIIIIIITIMTTFALSSSLTTEQNKIATKIIKAMISGDSFEDWSEAFLNTNDETNGPNILNATLFLPKTSVQGLNATSPLVASYHIVPQRLGFNNITLMKPLARLSTLLYGNSIVVTNDSVSGFALDGVVISEPDLFVSPSVVIHRVASPFNFSRYGGDDHM